MEWTSGAEEEVVGSRDPRRQNWEIVLREVRAGLLSQHSPLLGVRLWAVESAFLNITGSGYKIAESS